MNAAYFLAKFEAIDPQSYEWLGPITTPGKVTCAGVCGVNDPCANREDGYIDDTRWTDEWRALVGLLGGYNGIRMAELSGLKGCDGTPRCAHRGIVQTLRKLAAKAGP